MKLNWLLNGFIKEEHYAPFYIEKDGDYYDDLCKRLNSFRKSAKDSGADQKSLQIIENSSYRIKRSIREYYKGHISTCHNIIKFLIKDCLEDPLAVNTLRNSEAFGGEKGRELQFFRARINESAIPFSKTEMLHLPFSLRGKTGNYRFSIPGVPSLYLGNTSYACWLELGRPSEHDYTVSPLLVDDSLRVFNLAVMNKDFHCLDEFEEVRVHCWLRLMVLMMATSYRIREEKRSFKSEYIVSQGIMLACKELGLDGVAYYSKQVDDQNLAQAAINLALFVSYKQGKQFSEICNHIKIGDAFNYSFYKQLIGTALGIDYELRCLRTGRPAMVGSKKQPFLYSNTEFCRFDKFLFAEWKEKDNIDFGNAIQ